MPYAKNASHRKSVNVAASEPIVMAREGSKPTSRRPTAGTAIDIGRRAWKSIRGRGAGALKELLNGFGEAVQRSKDRRLGVRMVVMIDPQRRVPKVEIEDIDHSSQVTTEDFNSALAEARERGANRAAEILARSDMLSADAFARFIGVSREAVRLKCQRREVLGLEGAKRGVRFPKWQVTSNGGLLPELPRLFDLLGGDSWTVYRFLNQHHPELHGNTAISALKAGKVGEVLAAAENTGRGFS